MYKYKLDGINRMGEPHEKYGTAYWCTSPESDLPLKFNSMNADLAELIENGPFEIVAEEKEERESAKGTPYLSLKKVKLVEPTQITKEKVDEVFGSEKPADKPSASISTLSNGWGEVIEPMQAQLDRIESQLQELDSKIDRLLG